MSKTEIAKVLAGGVVRVLLAAGAVLALASAGGCGSVTAAQSGAPDASEGAHVGAAAGGTAGQGSQAGAPSGAAGSAAGGAAQAAGGTASGGQGGAAPISCGGPGYGAALCSHDSDCLSGKCAGGWCADCGPGGCKVPARCIDNGWVPDPVQDCSPSAEPLCMWGYRCLNCGPFPGGITACVYDRAGTSICVASCGDCAAL